MEHYLHASAIINFDAPAVLACARELARGNAGAIEIARRCFVFVRDEIRHSWDHRMNPVTLRASDVLAHRTGYCYAKSHLLAALLRANGIPAGLCYQRLALDESAKPFCLHGLNAVFLDGFGWYRMDARGNKPGVEAHFDPPRERLAFIPEAAGEADLPGIWIEPLKCVIRALSGCGDFEVLRRNLPDLLPEEFPTGAAVEWTPREPEKK
ncbi:MAG: transglutaminase family protein [Spirochaetes bacterium]|nr:MAG: transglutaminase family protein [Spirochaetota bacterium]